MCERGGGDRIGLLINTDVIERDNGSRSISQDGEKKLPIFFCSFRSKANGVSNFQAAKCGLKYQVGAL